MADFFAENEFYYGNINGDIYTHKLRLTAGGNISGYHHENETGWKVEDDTLYFLNSSGIVSRFFSILPDRSTQRILHGCNPDGTTSPVVLVRKTSDHSVSPSSMLKETLYSGFSPFNFVDENYVDTGYPHTNISEKVIEALVATIQPKLWLEVGSMLGGSAIRTADVLKSMEFHSDIVCIDPFCGDVNMWSWEREKKQTGEWQFLKLQRGRPTIFDRFLANVTAAGHSDIVLPITATSIVGLKLLRRLFLEGRLAVLPDVIYLDSAHEPDETLLELKSSWRTLNEGGVLFGDDWSWSAVRNDVVTFTKNITQNSARLEQLQAQHPHFEAVDGVLIDREYGQWILAK